jgi:hypothetical protein
LTFEIFEREAQIPIMDILRIGSGSLISGQSSHVLTGYAAQGPDARAALEPIIAVLPINIWPKGDGMIAADWDAPVVTTLLDDPAMADGRSDTGRPKLTRAATNRAPSALSIRHYDPDRDFQAGVQKSRLIGHGRNEAQIDFAAAITATSAKGFADAQLLQRWRGLNGVEATIARRDMPLVIGQNLSVPGSPQSFRITEIEHQRGTIRVSGPDWLNTYSANLVADPGRNQSGQDLVAGETRLILAELPTTSGDDPGSPIVVAAAAGTGAGWRRASLSRRNGSQYIELGGTNGVATMGNLMGPLPVHSPLLEDRDNQPVIRLLHDVMTLPTGSGDPFAQDAPALWIDGEIIRYGFAEKIAARDYRLKKLLRGCCDTSTQVGHAAAAEIFLLETDSLFKIDADLATVGSFVVIDALGIGDSQPVEKILEVVGKAIKPWRPVHGKIEKLPSGDLILNWVRRDRLANGWPDGVDLPNSEGFAEFAVELSVGGQSRRIWSTVVTTLQIAASEITALGISANTTLNFNIIHQGKYSRSAPLYLDITL